MSHRTHQPKGMKGFLVIWLSQLVSILATNMTTFALTIWAFQKTGQATALALVHVSGMIPFLLMSPVAGVMVDRYSRKLMMMVSDFGGGIGTIAVFILLVTGQLEIWHLYIVAAITGTANTFQWPAYSAAVSLMVPKEQYGRVNGLMSLMEVGPAVIGPLMAGALIGFIGLQGILMIDMITFVFAMVVLSLVNIPKPRQTAEGKKAQGSFLREAAFGFQFIFERKSLLGVQLTFLAANLFFGIGMVLIAPMVLSRTGNNEFIFSLTQTAGAVGGVLGGVIMGVWGGFRRRITGVLWGWMIAGLFSLTLVGLGTDIRIWIPAIIIGAIIGQVINASNQSIWMAKVPPDIQGRVFSARRLIAWVASPITPLIGAPLADFLLEPAMQSGGQIARIFGPIVGTGPGSGMALIMIFAGLGVTVVGIIAATIPAVRNIEDVMPDHDQDAKDEVQAELVPAPAD